MKKQYTAPEIERVTFEYGDQIAAQSGCTPDSSGGCSDTGLSYECTIGYNGMSAPEYTLVF